MIDSAADTIRDLATSGVREVHVAVCCKWGKHRSVSFAIELAEHLSCTCDDVLSGCEVLHLERHRWGRSHVETPPPRWQRDDDICRCLVATGDYHR